MFVNHTMLATNPFIESYIASDLFGKFIFFGLFALSILSWAILLYKGYTFERAKKNARLFYKFFLEHQKATNPAPLAIDLAMLPLSKEMNPFHDLYLSLKKQALSLLNKNARYKTHSQLGWLCSEDLDILAGHLQAEAALQMKNLEKNLYILSTVVSLAPFLGLLGTVWGILITFSHMQTHVAGGSQAILEGLSLALTTTVLGLVDAIPALLAYNYLKNQARDFRIEMDGFMTSLVTAVELQYRPVPVEIKEETASVTV